MLNKLRSKQGFTLIELLIVVAIIGILAAIAIPQFSSYQKRGYASAVRSDVKNADVAVKAWFSDNPGVTCATESVTGAGSFVAFPSARVSKSVTVAITGGLEDTYTVAGSHTGLVGKFYTIQGNGSVTTDDLSTAWN